MQHFFTFAISTAVASVTLLASPALAQRDSGLPDFFEEGIDRFEDEIENLERQNRGDDLLTVETEAAGWQTFVSEGGLFAIRLPEAPVEDRLDLPTDAGDVRLTRFRSVEGRRTFMVAYSDVPEEIEAAALLAAVRDRVVAGVPEAEEASPTVDRPITLIDADGETHAGREFAIATNDGVSVLFRTYVVGDRLYILGTNELEGSESEAETGFFDSFEILPLEGEALDPKFW